MPEDETDAGPVTLEFDPSGLLAIITLDRQLKLNALTLELLEEFERRLHEVSSSEARVLVLRTGGQKVFCVGGDISRFGEFQPTEMWQTWIPVGHRVFDFLETLRQPTIAVVDGMALGGGLELAMACDFRVAAETAQFGLPETGIGTVPGWGGTGRLTAMVGAARAKELILARKRISAQTAFDWGLVSEVAAAADLDSATDDLVARLLGGAPIALAASKQLIHAAAAGAPAAILEALASGFTAGTADFSEGTSSFREKRAAVFIGR